MSLDNHISDISVPILYLGAAGAIGTFGEHTGSLTASDDITNLTIQLQAEQDVVIDYGHADLFLANDASQRVWEPLRQWLVDHDRNPRRWKRDRPW